MSVIALLLVQADIGVITFSLVQTDMDVITLSSWPIMCPIQILGIYIRLLYRVVCYRKQTDMFTQLCDVRVGPTP